MHGFTYMSQIVMASLIATCLPGLESASLFRIKVGADLQGNILNFSPLSKRSVDETQPSDEGSAFQPVWEDSGPDHEVGPESPSVLFAENDTFVIIRKVNRPTSRDPFPTVTSSNVFLLPDEMKFWKLLNGFTDSTWTNETTTDSQLEVSILALVGAFFTTNWVWCMVVVIAVLLLFCIPGMVAQICGNRYYRAYRREKRNKAEAKLVEAKDSEFSSTVTPESDRSIPHAFQMLPLPDPPPAILQEADGIFAPTSEPLPPPPETNYLIEVPSIAQVELYSNTPITTPVKYTNPAVCNIINANVPTGDLGPTPGFSTYPRRSRLLQKPRVAVPLGAINEPVVVYPVEATSVTDSKPETSSKIDATQMAIGAEMIIDSNMTNTDKKPRQRHRMPRKKAVRKPPERPPKPKQYKIRPTPDKRARKKNKESNGKKDESKDKQPEETKSEKPNQKRQKRKKREQRLRTKPVDPPIEENPVQKQDVIKKSPTGKKTTNPEVKDLRRKEELLRQILQGLNEAEMLQRKLERTRKWTKDQKLHAVQRLRDKEKSSSRGRGKTKQNSSSSCNDVLSDTTAPSRNKTKTT
ncbi:unnamed protein product [Clavelina lepadiformis]|uniref:Uncharacterized protein n=1 Tax=Clavelina lepadiformis TaxID=159417 RepID=A0ABP0FXV6_CLALP